MSRDLLLLIIVSQSSVLNLRKFLIEKFPRIEELVLALIKVAGMGLE